MGIVADLISKVTGGKTKAENALDVLDAAILAGDTAAIQAQCIALELKPHAVKAIDAALLRLADLRGSLKDFPSKSALMVDVKKISAEASALPNPVDVRVRSFNGSENVPAGKCNEWRAKRQAEADAEIAKHSAIRARCAELNEQYSFVVRTEREISEVCESLPHNAERIKARNAADEKAYRLRNDDNHKKPPMPTAETIAAQKAERKELQAKSIDDTLYFRELDLQKRHNYT